MNLDLSRRLAAAMDRGDATSDERKLLTQAAQTAKNFSDLPRDLQRLIRDLEQGPPSEREGSA